MQTYKLKEIILENFGPFKNERLDFTGKDIIGILAEYADNPDRSNRAGKSFLTEAIRYNLTGLHRYKKETDLITRGEEYMLNTCIYEDSEGALYTIRRGRDAKNKGVLNLDWIEKSRESQEAIDELFGISKEDFDLTSFFKQSETNGFMNLSPTEKTKFLMKWMDNEHWKIKEERVKEDLKEFKNDLKKNENTIEALSDRESKEALEIELASVKKEYKAVEKELTDIHSKKSKTESEKNEIIKNRNSLKEQVQELEDRIKKSKKAENYQDRLNKQIDSATEELVEYQDTLKKMKVKEQDIDKLQTEMANKRSEYKNLNDKIKKLKENSSGICPIINESCDRITCSEQDLNKLKTNREKLKEEGEKLSKEIQKQDNFKSLKESVKRSKERVEQLKESIENLEEPESIKELEKQIKKLKSNADSSKLETVREKLAEINEELSEVKNKEGSLSQKIGSLNARIKNCDEANEKIERLYKQSQILRKKIEILQSVQLMFSKNGIPADEIENAFKEVEDDINFILKHLQTGLTVSFSPDKELSKWEPVCHCGFSYPKGFKKAACPDCGTPRYKQRKEEISLKIMENGVESDFEGDSGGGKSIISYAVRIALTMLKRRQNKCRLNMLFLDEVDSALDSHLAASITDSITKLLTKRLGYEQILMISHKEEIKNAIPYIIRVTKQDSIESTAAFI